MVMVIYHYVERIGEFLLPPIFCIIYTRMKKYYPGKLVDIHLQSLISIIQDKNWVRLGAAQDFDFFYKGYHMSELKTGALNF